MARRSLLYVSTKDVCRYRALLVPMYMGVYARMHAMLGGMAPQGGRPRRAQSMDTNTNRERMSRRVDRTAQERSRAGQHVTRKDAPAARIASRARRQAQRMGGQR